MFDLGILFGLFSMLGYGLSTGVISGLAKKYSPEQVTVYRNFFVSLILLVALLFYLSSSNFDVTFIVLVFGIAVLGYFSVKYLFKALRVGKVGVVSPISNSAVVLTVLLSVIFFKEQLSLLQVVAIALVIFGVLLNSVDFKHFRESNIFDKRSGVAYALVTFVLWGFIFFFSKIHVSVLGPFLSAFLIELGILVYSYLDIRVSKMRLKRVSSKELFLFIVSAILAATGTLFYNLGVQVGVVSIVAVLSFSNPIAATFYSKVVNKETLKLKEMAALILIVLGVALVTF